MLKLSPLHDDTKDAFAKLFENYYKELGCTDDVNHLVEEYVLPDLLAGLLNIDILKDGEEFAGFIIYQTDGIENDWNFKEGWGDIREIYVIPPLRRQGLGKFMLYAAEMKLKERGTEKAYCLPYASAEEFFTACGYKKTEGYSEELDCPVFEKLAINVHDCGK